MKKPKFDAEKEHIRIHNDFMKSWGKQIKRQDVMAWWKSQAKGKAKKELTFKILDEMFDHLKKAKR